MTQTGTVGLPTSGKPINLSQLRDECMAAGTDLHLGMTGDFVFTYDDAGGAADFSSADQPIVEQAISAHVAMRDKTDQELAAEFQASSDPQRKQEIRDQQAGLIPREQVPM